MGRFVANGYEIFASGGELRFIDRRTWGLGWLMVVLSVLAALLVALSGLNMAQLTELPSGFPNAALPVAAVLLLIAWGAGRTYRIRRDRPIENIQDVLIVDRSGQVLRDTLGEIAAELSDVRARMHVDWWTRGTMRIVVLSWPGGRRVIYRTFGRRGCLDLLSFLKEQGIDAR